VGLKGDLGRQLVDLCPTGVFDIEDLHAPASEQVAVVKFPRNCTMCRECIRLPEWQKRIQLRRVKDHYLFSIESTGILSPTQIFRESLQILSQKSTNVLNHYRKSQS